VSEALRSWVGGHLLLSVLGLIGLSRDPGAFRQTKAAQARGSFDVLHSEHGGQSTGLLRMVRRGALRREMLFRAASDLFSTAQNGLMFMRWALECQ